MLEFKRNKPSWLTNDLLSIVHPDQPQVLKYRGLWNDDARQQNEIAHSETELDRLREKGVGLVWIDFYAGFGLEFEKAELERARALIAAAHARGLKVAARVQFGALTTETLLLEENDCQNWLQLNHAGQNPVVAEDAFFRVRPCFNSEGWLRYMERVCGTAVEFGADAVHFENTGNNAEPDTCKCPICVAAFRDRLRQQFGSQDDRTRQAGRERWGHNTFTHVRPPVVTPGMPGATSSPHVEEWNSFQIQTLAAALARLAQGIQKRNPECAISADVFKNSKSDNGDQPGKPWEQILPLLNIATACLQANAPQQEELETVASHYSTAVTEKAHIEGLTLMDHAYWIKFSSKNAKVD